MKRLEDSHGIAIERTIDVDDYVRLAPDVPSPQWVSVHSTGSSKMLGYVVVFVLVVAVLAPKLLGAIR